TAKSDVIVAGVDIPFAASAHHVTRTILVRAEKRSAALHTLRRVIAGIIAGIRTQWIPCYDDTPELQPRVIVGPIPVAAPLPNVACHVVKSVTVRWKLRNRRGACEP